MEEKPDKCKQERRDFLRFFGSAVACAGAAVAANAVSAAARSSSPNPAITDYDWNKHRWAFGVDATRCIGCLRCVEACKVENSVVRDASHFRTWVERYVYLEGETKARIDSQADPQNIAPPARERNIASTAATKTRRSRRPSSCRSCATSANTRRASRYVRLAPRTRPRTAWC
jgi:formate hydrogenlyase subunit 6/NADH:ubiquinone oxidoreductase subunit I